MAASTQHQSNSTPTQEEEINIFLKIMKTVPLTVKKYETIKDLKALLCENFGFPENRQDLFLGGDLLMDTQRLVDCGVHVDSTVHLVLQNADGIKLFVKLPSAQDTIEIEAKAHHTIRNIKAMIQTKKMIPSGQFTLVCGGQLLEEESTLALLGIRNESMLQMISTPKDHLSIYVKAAGETFKLKVRPLFTVSDVKTIAGNVLCASVSDKSLFYAGNQLEDRKTLAFYDIRDECILEIGPRRFQIFVKTWNGKTITLDVTSKSTVSEVKDKILCKVGLPMGMPVRGWSIVFAGKRLEDNFDIASYNIQKDSTLFMVASW